MKTQTILTTVITFLEIDEEISLYDQTPNM